MRHFQVFVRQHYGDFGTPQEIAASCSHEAAENRVSYLSAPLDFAQALVVGPEDAKVYDIKPYPPVSTPKFTLVRSQ